MKRQSSIGPNQGDLRLQLTKQQNEYQSIKERSSRIIQLFLSVISVVGSLSILRLISGGGVAIGVSNETFNQSTPGAISGSGVRLVGFGGFSLIVAVALLLLALYLFFEIFLLNRHIQKMSVLHPKNPADLLDATHWDWILENRRQINTANQYLSRVHGKTWYAAGSVLVAFTILVIKSLSMPFLLAVVNFLFTASGAVLIGLWVYQYHSDEHEGMDDGFLELRTQNASPLFIFFFGLVEVYAIQWHWQLFKLIGYFI